jgi:hypothetical protein
VGISLSFVKCEWEIVNRNSEIGNPDLVLASNFHADHDHPLAGSPFKRLALPRSVFVFMPVMDVWQVIMIMFFFGMLVQVGMSTGL